MTLEGLASVECTIAGGLARVVLNAPERGNPIDGVFCREIRDVAVELSERDDVRAVLLSARGKYFSVGGDIKAFTHKRSALPSVVKTWTADLHAAVSRLMRMRAPVVAAVHGNAAGGGVSLAASADVVYAAQSANFVAAFPMIGFSADSGSTITLSQRMGLSRAKRFLLLSETLKAEQALATGLVDFVTADETLLREAETMALRLAAGATGAYGGIKQLMLRARTQGLESQMEDEAEMLASVARSDDAWEGLSAFRAKRAPNFRGR